MTKTIHLRCPKCNKAKKKYNPKPYEQMQSFGQRVQIGVKVVPRGSICPGRAENIV